jgi:hypothetical protein
MQHVARDSPATKQNKTGCGRAEQKEKREEPCIDVAAARDTAHESIEARHLVKPSAKLRLNRPTRYAVEEIGGNKGY